MSGEFRLTPMPRPAPGANRVDPATCFLAVRPAVGGDAEQAYEGVILERGKGVPTLRVTGPDMHTTLARLRQAIRVLGL